MKNIKLNESLGYLFHTINLNMKKRLEHDIKSFNFSTSHQFGVLILLSKKSMTQKEISNAIFADESSITRLLDRMIKKEVVVKSKSLDDRRKKVISITKKGVNLLNKILPIVSENNKHIERLLNEDECYFLFKILNKINDQITEN